MAPPVHELIVAGVRRPAADGATFTTYNPATGQPLAEVAQAGRADLDAALDAARAGFADGSGEWASTSATERGKVLARAAQLIRERADEFAETEVADAGHTISDARWEAGAMAEVISARNGCSLRSANPQPTVSGGRRWRVWVAKGPIEATAAAEPEPVHASGSTSP